MSDECKANEQADAYEEQIAELIALRDAATTFRLGKASDDDRRDYVSVHRQYGVPAHQQWVAVVVGESGMKMDTARVCRDQAVALFHGVHMLNEIRRA